MRKGFLWKSLDLLTKRQTNILSAAFVIMATVVFSQILGLIRQRLMVASFGVSQVGIYDFATTLPDTIFQLTIAAALSSAFIPVFSDYLNKDKEKEGHQMASTLLFTGFLIFFIFSCILALFANFFLQIFNLGNHISAPEMNLMANLMRIFIFGELLFIVGTFFTALLQSYNHFFIPALAAALYNLGIIIGILLFSSTFGIYSTTIGVILGGFIYVIVQIPLARRVGFRFRPSRNYFFSDGVRKVGVLMWPRTLSIIISQFGTIVIGSFISFIPDPTPMNAVYNLAKTLAFAPVVLIGNAIAQAAFPVLSREKDNPQEFKATFISSFNQMLYLVLPISVLILVLRIPLVRLVYGAGKFSWADTILTGRTLAFFCISIFAQALITLTLRGFYALHDTKIPLIISAISTAILLATAYTAVIALHFGVVSLAVSFSFASLIQLAILFIMLEKKVGGFDKPSLLISWFKLLASSFFTAFALYIPLKLLDQLVFDTTRTINLLMLTGISSLAGLSLYLFLTWLFNVKEASTYILVFRKLGNWRDIMNKVQEVIEGGRVNP